MQVSIKFIELPNSFVIALFAYYGARAVFDVIGFKQVSVNTIFRYFDRVTEMQFICKDYVQEDSLRDETW